MEREKPQARSLLGERLNILSIIERKFLYSGEAKVTDYEGVLNNVHVMAARDYWERLRTEPRPLGDLALAEENVIEQLIAKGLIPNPDEVVLQSPYEDAWYVHPGSYSFKIEDEVYKLLFLPTKAKADEVLSKLRGANQNKRSYNPAIETFGIITKDEYRSLFIPQS